MEKRAVTFAVIGLFVLAAVAVVLGFISFKTPEAPSGTKPEVMSSTATTSATSAGKVAISGAGATFLAPQMFEWARIYTQTKGVVVEYQSVGSGAGRDMFFRNVTHFGASDVPLSKELYEKYRGRVLQIPVVIGSIAIVYNIPEIPENTNLCLSGDVIALIYKGEIKRWDDERILSDNPSLKNYLLGKEIVAVHRSDSSGTTGAFTIYLNKVAPNIWTKDLVGLTVDWPADKVAKGVGGKGNEGVTQVVQTTPYSIGYVELNYALLNKLRMAAVKNADGYCVVPNETTIVNAVKSAFKSGLAFPQTPLDDWSDVPQKLMNAPGRDSYPIVSFSFLLFWREYPKELAGAIKDFINWLNTEGQGKTIVGYLPIPEEVREINLKALQIIEGR